MNVSKLGTNEATNEEWQGEIFPSSTTISPVRFKEINEVYEESDVVHLDPEECIVMSDESKDQSEHAKNKYGSRRW